VSAAFLPELSESLARWVEHCAEHPDALRLVVAELRRPSGLQEIDAARVLLAEVVQGVGRLTEGKS
jgi:hypothetical protein